MGEHGPEAIEGFGGDPRPELWDVSLEVRSGERTFRCRVHDTRAVGWPADVELRIVPDRAVLLPEEG